VVTYYRLHRFVVSITKRHRYDSVPAIPLAKLRERNLVFTVTAGRTGTLFAQLFALLPDTTSVHEPAPTFHAYLRRIKRDHDFAKKFLLYYKLPFIAAVPSRNYVEFSHVFCKGFLEPLLELGLIPNLLLFWRPPRLIALSYFERNVVPERTFYGLQFLLSPRHRDTLPLPAWRHKRDYQLIFWYALEIELRQCEYSHLVRAAGGAVCDVTANDLRDFQRFVDIIKNLSLLSPNVHCDTLLSQHAANGAISWNQNFHPLRKYRGDLDAEEEQVWQAISVTNRQLRSSIERRYNGLGGSPETGIISPQCCL